MNNNIIYTEQGSLEGLEMWHVKDDHGVWHKEGLQWGATFIIIIIIIVTVTESEGTAGC